MSPQPSNQQTYTIGVIASIAFDDFALLIIITFLCRPPNGLVFFSTATFLNKEHYMCAKHYQNYASLIQITVTDILLSGC